LKRRELSRREVFGLTGTAAVVSAAPGQPAERAEYPLYRARGTHRELGRQHGEQAARQIKAHIEMMRARPKLSEEQFKHRVAAFQHMFEQHCPHLLDEMRGLAEGAGVTLEDAMLCSIRGELSSAPAAGCTTYAIGRRGSAGHEVIAGQNADLGSQMIPLAYVLHLQPQNKPEVLIWTFGGMLGYHGMNSAGVAHFSNALSGGPRSQFGMPEYVYERLMLECSSTEQVINVLRKLPLASNENFMICDREGNIADAEATTAGPEVLLDQGAGYLAHTNHFLCDRYSTAENLKLSLPDSAPRHERINALIKSRYGSIELDDIKRFLSDHSGYPTSICRHASDMQTVASMISEPVQRRMHVALGNPCQHRYVTYSM
jgi:isopenicillin-N N-acyltransferase-like protein